MGQIAIGDVVRTHDTGMMHSIVIEHPLSKTCNKNKAKRLQALAMQMMDVLDEWHDEDLESIGMVESATCGAATMDETDPAQRGKRPSKA